MIWIRVHFQVPCLWMESCSSRSGTGYDSPHVMASHFGGVHGWSPFALEKENCLYREPIQQPQKLLADKIWSTWSATFPISWSLWTTPTAAEHLPEFLKSSKTFFFKLWNPSWGKCLEHLEPDCGCEISCHPFTSALILKDEKIPNYGWWKESG